MANVLVVLAVLLVGWFVFGVLRRRRHGIIPKRGMGIGADLGALADTPLVRVTAVVTAGPGRVRVVLTPGGNATKTAALGPGAPSELDVRLVVDLAEDDFGFELLQEWCRSEQPLAMVMPPDSRIVRLRSIGDLQHLSLRRLDQG